ncbi:LON peptidase substrate-binding domain-containing protein [Sinimarinibacterium sp. CAU 1509]|uniref:LON peptidase substrate-binding domain-containing protein n=1 Tax=Sinimarinibacterium sp. CAU 1509 TaxID=2562283 RepID=UPI001B7F7A7B|nr:LON peptidase substrate-binding domain-containing protein [Sinimarinibacterium sp. CAU 1509]
MRLQIPIFPLGTVLYPGGRLPLRIFEPRYVAMTRRCLAEDAVFGVSLILDGQEVGAPAVPHAVGCSARIVDSTVLEADMFALLAIGESAFRIQRRETQADGLILAEVEWLAGPAPMPVPSEYAPLVQLLRQAVEQMGEGELVPPLRYNDSAWVARRLAERLPMPVAARQRILECADPLQQLSVVAGALAALGAGSGRAG